MPSGENIGLLSAKLVFAKTFGGVIGSMPLVQMSAPDTGSYSTKSSVLRPDTQ